MRTGILTKVYGGAVTALAPLVVLGCAVSPRGRRRLHERLGCWGDIGDVGWWMHGASVGEVQGLLPLIREIRAREEGAKILLTSTSPTGLDRAEAQVSSTRLLPIDAPLLVRRATSSVRPQRCVIAETELWPSLLRNLQQHRVPCHIVNGRISDYTVSWYRMVRSVFAPLLAECASISVASDTQRARFLELGARSERVHVTGHTKFDVDPRFAGSEQRRDLRRRFFGEEAENAHVIVLGSLRPGEERAWFPRIKDALSSGAGLKVIVAPRHMEKTDYFARELEEVGVRFSRWSERTATEERVADVVLLDVMGMLEEAYAICSLAFIGGTLVDVGGHNPLEAAMYGVPVVVGPYTSVISDVVSEMRSNRGVCDIGSSEDIGNLLSRVVSRDAELVDIGARGRDVWVRHRGASQRILSVIEDE